MTVAKKAPSTTPTRRKKPKVVAQEEAKAAVLHPGDKLEMGISVAVRINGMESWVKVGGETVIREDEDYKGAGTRLRSVVERYLDGSVKSLQEALS